MGYVHLGIDYGTSASKMLVRDYDAPGGEKVYPLVREGTFRIPSDIAIARGRIYFGRAFGAESVPHDAVWYQAVKMRIAFAHGERLVGTPPETLPLPDGWTFDEIAVLSISWLILQARAFAETQISHHRTPLKLGMTLGIPSDFRFSPRLKKAFLSIAIAAWTLAKRHRVGADEQLLTDNLHRDVQAALALSASKHVSEEELNLWLRSEARASIWWAWQLPTFITVPYIKVDVGAGTTNVAAFLIRQALVGARHVKDGIAVLGAASGTIGMNTLLTAVGCNAGTISFPPLGSIISSRNDLRAGLELPYRRVFGRVYELTGGQGPARQQWLNSKIMMLGGGSLSNDVCNVFRFDPRLPSHNFEPAVFNSIPTDLVVVFPNSLSKKQAAQSTRVSLSVAYGLSVPEDTLPSEMRPDQIEPILPRERSWSSQNLAGIYEK